MPLRQGASVWWWAAACATDETTPTGGGTPDPTAESCGIEVVTVVETQPHPRLSDRAVAVTLSGAAPAALLCRAQDDPDDRYLLEHPEPAATHTFALQGVRSEVTYDCAVAATCPGAVPTPLSVVGAPPPAFSPATEVSGVADPDGWLLAGVLTQGCLGPGALAIFDLQGRLRWHQPLDYTGLDFELSHLGDGVLLYGGHSELPGPVSTHVWDGELFALDVPGDAFLHHDCKQIADGRILTLEERTNTDRAQSWTGFAVRAYDPATGAWEELYDSQAAVDEGALPVGAGDAWHANWIDVRDHGEGPKLYVSLCFIDRVLRIDLATRTVDWTLGAGGDFAYASPNGPTSCQHGLEVSDDGTRLLVYDNGVDRGESRALEYTLDLAARTATVEWTWTDGWYEPLLGDVDWLPGGDVLVTQGHPECFVAEGLTSVVQIDPLAGEERWRMTFPDPWHAAYRSERLDGCALFSNVGACSALEPRWAELAGAFGLD